MVTDCSIKSYHQDLLSNKISCLEAVNHCLQNIETHRELNGFLEVFETVAIQQAKIIDQQIKAGQTLKKLSGVIIGIKDVFCFEGHISSAGSKMLSDYVAIYTATAIKRLQEAGAIIIGRQNCDEFAMGSANANPYYGQAKNPINPQKVPGGSSGGSALTVKTKQCMISIGSDTGGSVRQPADFCGVVGYKPSYGRVSRNGLIAYASSLDGVGIISNYVQDIQEVLEVIAGPDLIDNTAIPEPYYPTPSTQKSKFRLAYFKSWLEAPGLDPEIKAAITSYFNNLPPHQYEIVEYDFPFTNLLVPTYYIIATAEAASNLARYDGLRYGYNTANKNLDLVQLIKANRTESFGNEVKKRILIGNFVLGAEHHYAYYDKAVKIRTQMKDYIQQIMQDCDAIIAPTVPTTAFDLNLSQENPEAVYLADIFTVLANLTGIPAIALPCFKHSNGLPFGLQLMGKFSQDNQLLELAQQLFYSSNKLN